MPLSPALGAVIQGGLNLLGGLGSSGMSAAYNSKEAQKDRDFQKSMYEQQVQDNIKFWDMQNKYNLPSAQLQRIQDAGLNPLLMYGEGGLSGNLASQAPQPGQAPHGSTARANFQNPMELANIGLVQAQADALKAEAEKDRQDIKESQQREFGQSIDNEVAWRTRDAKVAIENKNVVKLDHEIEWLATQDFALTNMTAANLDNIASMIVFRQKYYDLDSAKTANQMWYNIESIAIGKAHVSNELKQIAVDLYRAKTDRQRVEGELKVFAAQVDEINSRKDLTDAQKSHEYLKAYNQVLKNTLLDNTGTESLGGPAGLMLLMTGLMSGRIDN